MKPDDADAAVPQVWQWKQPGFTNVCNTIASTLPSSVNDDNDWAGAPGYFEAGSALPSLPFEASRSFTKLQCLFVTCFVVTRCSGCGSPLQNLSLLYSR